MGGLALLLFWKDAVPVAAVSAEVYRLIASPTLPAIPLLTAAGYILAEGGASTRLVRFFRALFGWMPGGLAVMVAAVCALFTTFTGGSGVTIIALGGLVYPILRDDGYPEGFSLGLVTAAGSLGLLFPPSLPVILYSVVASVPADSLYIAGLVPGLPARRPDGGVGHPAGAPARRGGPHSGPASQLRELAASFWQAKWELALPVLVIVLFATGFASMVEASAAACAYAAVVECFVTRDIHPFRQLPGVLVKAGALMGAVLILLSVAMGLTSWLVDAQVPTALLDWVKTHVSSPLVFLLVLNVILLVLGSVLEIYSAIVILAPLVAPMGAAFGIDPIHLGVIFLANLELGFLFPPVGLNLFLSSSRFGVPLPKLYRHVVPFLLILGAGVLLITYVPAMSVGPPRRSSASDRGPATGGAGKERGAAVAFAPAAPRRALPRRSRLRPRGLLGLDRGEVDREDDVLDEAAAGEVVHRLGEALEHRADADDVRRALDRLVGDVPGVQVGEDEDGRLPGDVRLRRLQARDVGHDGRVVLERPVEGEVGAQRARDPRRLLRPSRRPRPCRSRRSSTRASRRAPVRRRRSPSRRSGSRCRRARPPSGSG